jgi:ribonuclease R
MKQATYDVANLGHFGLASEAYLHFTSPIRRYPDLVDHRIVHAQVEPSEKERRRAVGKATEMEKLTEAAMQSSLAERRAMEVEREIVDIYRCFYMINRIGERFEGTVSAFVGAGAFVTLDEPFVDVMVKVEDMGPDFEIEDGGLMAVARWSGEAIRLGDRLVVDVSDVAILRRTVYAKRVRADGEAFVDDRKSRGGHHPAMHGARDAGRHGSSAKGGGARHGSRGGKGSPAPGRHGSSDRNGRGTFGGHGSSASRNDRSARPGASPGKKGGGGKKQRFGGGKKKGKRR